MFPVDQIKDSACLATAWLDFEQERIGRSRMSSAVTSSDMVNEAVPAFSLKAPIGRLTPRNAVHKSSHHMVPISLAKNL